MSSELQRWQVLENGFLNDRFPAHKGSFTVEDVAEQFSISNPEASSLIQGYRIEIRKGEDSKAKFSLVRQGRTRATTWRVGRNRRHAQNANHTLYEDLIVKVEAWEKDLGHMTEIDPRVAEFIVATIDAMSGLRRMIGIVLEQS